MEVDSVDNPGVHYGIDRKAASLRLKVSVRTVDRYIKQGKLSTRVRDGRVWLSNAGIEALMRPIAPPCNVDNVDIAKSGMSIDNSSRQRVDTGSFSVSTSSTSTKTKNIYQKFYEELKKESKSQQERLEVANYRVGQLESRVETSIPLLELASERKNHQEQIASLAHQIKKSKDTIADYIKNLKSEKRAKIIFLIILFCILILQPLWIWLSVVK